MHYSFEVNFRIYPSTLTVFIYESNNAPTPLEQVVVSRKLALSCLSFHDVQASKVNLGTTIYGKPQLRWTNEFVFFNISHTQKLTVATASKLPVGIDIELTDRIQESEIETLSRYLFNSSLDAQRCLTLNSMTELWVIKEAVLKASGYGLWGGLKNIDIQMYNTGHGTALHNDKKYEISIVSIKKFTVALAILIEEAITPGSY